jgi:hypothetical protein
MSRTLKGLILVTDILFLTYWFFSVLHIAGLFELPASMMYDDFEQARVFAWNWSFFPIDVLFSITGLLAVRMSSQGDPCWRPMAIISLTLTFVAGFMAIGYWTILGEFDPAWYLPNLALVIWPLFFIRGLISMASRNEQPA